jgi:hypothetical protein
MVGYGSVIGAKTRREEEEQAERKIKRVTWERRRYCQIFCLSTPSVTIYHTLKLLVALHVCKGC